jgi:hypothetical protein
VLGIVWHTDCLTPHKFKCENQCACVLFVMICELSCLVWHTDCLTPHKFKCENQCACVLFVMICELSCLVWHTDCLTPHKFKCENQCACVLFVMICELSWNLNVHMWSSYDRVWLPGPNKQDISMLIVVFVHIIIFRCGRGNSDTFNCYFIFISFHFINLMSFHQSDIRHQKKKKKKNYNLLKELQ